MISYLAISDPLSREGAGGGGGCGTSYLSYYQSVFNSVHIYMY